MSSVTEQLELLDVRVPARAGLVLGGVGVASSVIVDVASIDTILHGEPVLALLLHGVACGLLTAGLPSLLPGVAGLAEPMGRGVVLALSFFLPVIGEVGLTLALAYAHGGPREEEKEPFRCFVPPDLPFEPPSMGSPAGLRCSEAALPLVLRHAQDPEKRVAAVVALRRMAEPRATPLLRMALKDPHDEVRLLAYAFMEGIEKAIDRRLRHRLEALEVVPPEGEARLRKAIAQDLWDLSFLGLASAELEAQVLLESERHLERALELDADGGAALLLGRVRLRQGRPEEADEALERAQALGLPNVVVAPYRAESAFLRRGPDRVRAWLAELPSTSQARMSLGGMLRFWLREPGGG